jgi:hypothetical protein
MFIIKNRVNGEYDSRGLYKSMDTVNRSSWNKLAQAKNHVAQKVTAYYNHLQYVDWYIDADYIEIDETGTLNVFPVIDHLKTYFTDNYKAKYLTNEQKIKLGLN